MKLRVLLFLVFSSILVEAIILPPKRIPQSKVTIAWEASPSSEVVSYNLYWGTNGTRTYKFATNVFDLSAVVWLARTTNWIAATAQDKYGLESDYSQELVYLPVPPINLYTNLVINVSCDGWLESSIDLVNWVAWPNPSTITNPTPKAMFWRDLLGGAVTINRSYHR